MDNPRARYQCLADGCGFGWEEPVGRRPIAQPDPEKPGKTFSTWPSRMVVCPACDHPYVKWENYAEHNWNTPAGATRSREAIVTRRRAARMMKPATLMLFLVPLLANGVAAEPVLENESMDLIVQEFIAEMRAKANERTTVFVHLDDVATQGVDSMVNSVIGALVMPCNPMWADGCDIPMEALVRMLRDAGARLPAGGLLCDRATLHGLEACLPGFEVSPSPNGEQIYLTTQAATQVDDFDETVAERAEILARTDYAQLGICQDFMRDLYEWGVLDQVATGIAFNVTNNMAEMVKQAKAASNDQLRRGSVGFLMGFCTATMHIHMANLDGAENAPGLSQQFNVSGPALQSRTARLQNQDTFNPDYCRGHIGRLRDANAIDEVADVMLRSALEKAIEHGTSGTARQDIGQGFGYGLCSAVLNAVMAVK